MRILVIEDEVQLADAVSEILKRNKYFVDTVYDGADGLDYALTGVYDCILLDVMLPKMNGFEVLSNLRQEKISTPVIMLTAKSEVEDKITGLDGGLILFAFIEWVSGKKLHPKFLYYIQFVGLVIVGSLVVFALAGDIFYFTGGSK